MEEKTVLIVNARPNPDNQTALEAYKNQSMILFKAAGAKPLKKFKVKESLIGEQTPSLISMLEFPSEEVLKNVFESEAYQRLIPLREQAFLELNAFVSQSLTLKFIFIKIL